MIPTRFFLEEDPEHKCFKIIYESKLNGHVNQTIIDRDFIDSPKFKELKKILQRSGLTIVKINWGEVLKKQGYKKLPISFVARGTPIQLENLFRKIQNSGKLIKFEQITITKYRKEGLLIDAIVTGFKKEESSDVKG